MCTDIGKRLNTARMSGVCDLFSIFTILTLIIKNNGASSCHQKKRNTFPETLIKLPCPYPAAASVPSAFTLAQ